MLTAELVRRPQPLDRLAAPRAPKPDAAIDWSTPIDRSRWFFSEELTPLAYTTVYRELGHEHRLRYNQLTGMLSNELILLLETRFLGASLAAVGHGADADLGAAVSAFAADERRHADTWRQLNRLSAPEWYGAGDTYLCRPSPAIEALSRVIARYPVAWPVMFWMQLSQEERSVDISRRYLRMPADRQEPHYAAAYRDHLHDEVRHVQIDCHLIERFYATRPAAVRRINAAIFRSLVSSVFLRPMRSTVRIVELLASEYPELTPLLPRIVAELRTLPGNDDYQRMMYSRDATPITFAWFDRFEEFRSLAGVLHAYEPRSRRSRA